jgi:hypothetical protein
MHAGRNGRYGKRRGADDEHQSPRRGREADVREGSQILVAGGRSICHTTDGLIRRDEVGSASSNRANDTGRARERER